MFVLRLACTLLLIRYIKHYSHVLNYPEAGRQTDKALKYEYVGECLDTYLYKLLYFADVC